MKNNKIGEMLKMYRKQNQLTVTDVCIRLKEDYDMEVAEKTVYGWESNQAHPTADTFVAVCEIYQIPSLEPIYPGGTRPDTLILSEEEKELVRNYRKYSSFQPAVRQLLHMNLPKRLKPRRD